VANTRTSVITPAPTTPVTWDREPACSATAVRDPLVLTGNPGRSRGDVRRADPDHLLIAPRTCSPRRAANADAVDMVSASATTAMANAPEQRRQVTPRDSGNRERREALRNHANRVDPVFLQVQRVDRDRGQHHHDEDTRSLGSSRFSIRIPASEATPTTAAVAFASPCANPDTKARASAMSPSASTENPRSFGSWPTMIVSASPFR
jgi:hypothetical protein